MLVLKILGIIVLAFILICCIFEINERCKKRFKVPLFSKNITISLFVSSLFRPRFVFLEKNHFSLN